MHVDTCLTKIRVAYVSRMSHKETCGSFLSSNLVEEPTPDLEGVLLECKWGESVSWRECFLGRVFPGESVS